MNMILPRNELRISITSSCNMKCVYCHNEGNTTINSLSIEDIELLIKNSLKFGLKSIRITGGEPLLHEDIIPICQMIKEKYNLQIGINTNAILIDKLLYLISQNWIDRVVVGIDYYGDKCSKQSPIGKSANQILDNIKLMTATGVNVSISSVCDNNYEDLVELINFGIKNSIVVKIIEKVDEETDETTTEEFLSIKNKIIHHFSLQSKIDNIFNETAGYLDNKKVVVFFHSHCRIRECNLCKHLHLRVLSNGNFKPCLFNQETELCFKDGNIEEKIIKSLDNLGLPSN